MSVLNTRSVSPDRTNSISQGDTLHLVLRLCGGYLPDPVEAEMGIAPGGFIKQCILKDENEACIWEPQNTICFNVQILNSEVFRQVTGIDPPETPITAKTYTDLGLPYFSIYIETSAIKGDFDGIISVKAIDKAKAKATAGHANGKRKQRREDTDEPALTNPVVLLNSSGIKIGFCTVSELEKELSSINAVQF